MNSNPMFVLLTLAQLLRALLASTAPADPATVMPVPADNVTVQGLASNVRMIENTERNAGVDVNFGYVAFKINAANPNGVIVPSSSVTVSQALASCGLVAGIGCSPTSTGYRE